MSGSRRAADRTVASGADPADLAGPVLCPAPAGVLQRGAPFFVWGVWALALIAALTFLAEYARDIPYYDELSMIPVLTGDQPVSLRWLWSDHNGHRLPVPRLLLLALHRLTNTDFRAGMYFNVFAMAALSAAMIVTAQRLRGWSAYADAFFPLALLHWGHAENFLWNWQVGLFTPVTLAGVLLLVIAIWGTQLPVGTAALVGLGVLALAMCGMPGLVYVPALALWLMGVGVWHWRSHGRHARRYSLAICGMALGLLALVVFYAIRYRANPYYLQAVPPAVVLRTALKFLTGGLGYAGQVFWPLSGVTVLSLLALTGGGLLFAVLRGRPLQRSRATGLLFFMAALLCLALSTGLGRPGHGFATHYFILAAPALCWAYIAWLVCGPPAGGRFVQTVLFTLAAFTFAFNFPGGRDLGRVRREKAEALQADLRAGKSLYEILGLHGPTLYPFPFGGGATAHPWLEDCLRSLHRAGIGDFRLLKDEWPTLREVALPPEAAVSGETTEGDGLRPEGTAETYRLFLLAKPRFVYGIRLNYWVQPGDKRIPFIKVYWKRSDQAGFPLAQRYIQYPNWGETIGPSGQRTIRIWVYGRIGQLRIHPHDESGRFGVLAVTLLVPATEEVGSSGD
jgi:hypothetical protein